MGTSSIYYVPLALPFGRLLLATPLRGVANTKRALRKGARRGLLGVVSATPILAIYFPKDWCIAPTFGQHIAFGKAGPLVVSATLILVSFAPFGHILLSAKPTTF